MEITLLLKILHYLVHLGVHGALHIYFPAFLNIKTLRIFCFCFENMSVLFDKHNGYSFMMKLFRALGYEFKWLLVDIWLSENYVFSFVDCVRIWLFCLHFRKKVVRRVRRLNPLVNTRAMLRLNPYAAVLKRQATLAKQKRQQAKDVELAKKRGVSTTN